MPVSPGTAVPVPTGRAGLIEDLQALSRLHRLAMQSLEETGLAPILGEILDAAIAISSADFGTAQLLDPATSDLRIVAQRGFEPSWVEFWNDACRGRGVHGSAIEHAARVIIEDVETSAVFAGQPALEIQRQARVRAVQSTPLLSRAGKPIGVLSTHFSRPHRPAERELHWLDLLARQAADTVDHAQVTAGLRRSAARFRALATAGWDVLYCMSPDWSQMCFLEGRGIVADAAEASHDWLARYIDQADQPRVLEAVRAAIGTKSVFDLEHRVRRVDGSLGWAHSRAVPVLDGGGEIVEWLGAARDVTDVRQAASALADERQRLESLLQSLPVGVVFSDSPDCERMTGNAAVLDLLEAGADDNISASARDPDALGRRIVYLHDGRPISADELPLQRAAREGREFGPIELELRLPSGAEKSVEVSAAPIRNADGQLLGVLAVLADTAERRRATLAHEQTRLKDEFLAVLGHELRNPLAAIAGAMDALRHAAGAAQRDSLHELVRRQAGVLRRLVDDLLDVSRITQGQIRLQKEDIVLSDLLNFAAEAALPAFRQRQQDLLVSLQPGPTRFNADRVRLRQILANLLDNASKYTHAGGRIELSGAREGDEIVLRCKDNGPGIAADMLERVFEPLVRVESAACGADGLGLGLTLVRRLAELHGGGASVVSRGPGAGSEFIVRIPFVAAGPMPAVIERPLAVARPASIVLVEDHDDVALSLTLVLEQAGHRVSRFADGRSALAAAAALAPDVVLIDIGLPGMSGLEVLAGMRQQPGLGHALFICSSGLPPAVPTSAAAGFDHYLVKPIDIDELLALIGQHLARAKPLRTLLVEDHADMAKATAWLLRHEGLEVEIAPTGRDAIETALRQQPEIVLCDMNLPDMSGLDVIRELRQRSDTSQTYFAMLTASSDDELRAYNERSGSLGVDEFISKPLRPEWIRSLVARPDRGR